MWGMGYGGVEVWGMGYGGVAVWGVGVCTYKYMYKQFQIHCTCVVAYKQTFTIILQPYHY